MADKLKEDSTGGYPVDNDVTTEADVKGLEQDSPPQAPVVENEGTTVEEDDGTDFPWSKPKSLMESVKDPYLTPEKLHGLLQSGEDVNRVEDSGEGYGPVHYVCIVKQKPHKNKKMLLVELAIHGHANMDLTTTRSGRTPLHLAVKANDLECVKTLVSLEADVNKPDLDGNTPLDMAEFKAKHGDESDIRMTQFDRNRTVVVEGREARERGYLETMEFSQSYKPSNHASNINKKKESEIIAALKSVGGRRGLSDKRDQNGEAPHPKRRKEAPITTSGTQIGMDTFPSPPIGFQPVPLGMNQVDCKYYKGLEVDIQSKLKDVAFNPTPMEALELVKKLQQQEGYQAKYGSRILCLDGGGIRGLLQMAILQEIERRMGKRITDLFDWIVGTSTGGVIALALCYGPKPTGKKSVRQLRDLYWAKKDEVFAENSGDGLFTFLAKGNSKNLEEVLQEWLGVDVVMDREPTTPGLMPKVVIPAVHKKDDLELHYFNNCFGDERSKNLVWKVARYTSAAPFYFTEFENYIDGGILANNPAQEGLTVIQEHYRKKGEKLPISMVVSVGSGINPTTKSLGKINVHTSTFNPNTWMNFFGVVEKAVLNKTAHDNCQSRCREQGINYFRFNPILEEVVDSGQKDSNKLLGMIWKTRCYLEEVRGEMDQLEKLLRDSLLKAP